MTRCSEFTAGLFTDTMLQGADVFTTECCIIIQQVDIDRES